MNGGIFGPTLGDVVELGGGGAGGADDDVGVGTDDRIAVPAGDEVPDAAVWVGPAPLAHPAVDKKIAAIATIAPTRLIRGLWTPM
jgi:hypothetical protein